MFRSSYDYIIPKTCESGTSGSKSSETPKHQCEWCEESWESESEVDFHKRKCHSKEIEQLQNGENVCQVKPSGRFTLCLKELKSRSELLRHVMVDHLLSSPAARRIEREIYVCDYCNQIFFNKQLLSFHIRIAHTERKLPTSKPCPKCSRQLRPTSLWGHLEKHRMRSSFCCPMCLKWCHNIEGLRSHLINHPKHYYCDICAYTVYKQESFDYHTDRHRNQPPTTTDPTAPEKYFIPLKYDKKTTYHRQNFNGIVIMNNIKICALCREICIDDSEMVKHLKRHHMLPDSDEKRKYRCQCGENFFNNVLLKHHVFKLKGEHKAL